MRFVLVHGGMHGGWCWDRVVEALNSLGHAAIAPDLPGHGDRAAEQQTMSGYVQTVTSVVEPGDVLVGHSLGGTVISLAADRLPKDVAHVVYVAAPIPVQGRPLLEVIPFMADVDAFAVTETDVRVTSVEGAADVFYQDCTPNVVRGAFDKLVSQSLEPFLTPIELGNFWTSDIPRSYITCLDDRTGLLAAVEGCVARLGLRTAYPMWSSHSPFLSRPDELAQLLCEVVDEPCRERG